MWNGYSLRQSGVIVMLQKSLIARKALLALRSGVLVGAVGVPALLGAALIVAAVVRHQADSTSFFQLLIGAGFIIGAVFLFRRVSASFRVGVREARGELGLCLKCGYDLRASKDRCPECGEEFSK